MYTFFAYQNVCVDDVTSFLHYIKHPSTIIIRSVADIIYEMVFLYPPFMEYFKDFSSILTLYGLCTELNGKL